MKTEYADCGIDRRESFLKRKLAAFTLIELLVVIAIIGILAGLIVGGMTAAKAKSAQYAAESQRDALVTAIERYHQAYGYYPPDHVDNNGVNIDSVQNPLFYEITGCTEGGGAFTNNVTREVLSTASLNSLFNVGGILNGLDPTTMKNWYPNLKPAQHSMITNGNGTTTFSVFGITAKGPLMLYGTNVIGGQPINPFHYVKSNPTNNPSSFDLWVDVFINGNTNRVSNWSPVPKPL